jgi:signal transduction histidine kinase
MEEIPQALSESRQGINQVSRIVQAMKEFSHPGGKEKEPVNLNQAIESAVIVARNEWKYSADLKMDLDPTLPPVPCLPGEFSQVLLNLLVNAAHAITAVGGETSNTKGQVTVQTSHEPEPAGWAVVRVSDTGTGIPAAIQPHIFDPFFTTKEVGKGSGQGLAICHDVVVNKLGGQITFETQPDQGTTFIVRLPLVVD